LPVRFDTNATQRFSSAGFANPERLVAPRIVWVAKNGARNVGIDQREKKWKRLALLITLIPRCSIVRLDG